jgi:serpin B
MVVMLPGAGLEQAEAALTPEALQKLIGGLDTEEVSLTLPKFKMESMFKLKETLGQLGMTEACSPAADFSGIDGRKYLMIGQVIHKAFIAIDEAGTEAAAATAVIMPPGAMPTQPRVVRVDRPFLFVIRDIQTGAILFVGRVVEPKLS